MFKFNFDVDDDDTTAEQQNRDESDERPTAVIEKPCTEISLTELLSTLPPVISYSPLAIPLTSQRHLTLARRDLFDARFQLIQSEDSSGANDVNSSDLEFLDAPSDLVPGVWDARAEVARNLRGKRVLELGCGTAIPSLYLLNKIFSDTERLDPDVYIHLQDYNDLVLRLVTLPNLILAWYMSPASAAYRSTAPASDSEPDSDASPLPPADPTQPGELPLTPALTAAFLASLSAHHVHLHFFAGGWSAFDVPLTGGPYDLVLTSETIYRPDSLPSLVSLLRRASRPRTLDELTSELTISDAPSGCVCLVAAKLVYFGVGGGVSEFVRAVEREGGTVRTVWEHKEGVKRSVMRVAWAAE
ncbi:Histidine protein methyltransferase 1 [Grifola frondosa]|uniref:protein-histidine N-methyltransferase n=1 Tax=Grifola frondosa TaxID=5627 RepID=A0A1C7MLC0_GRIFR|nr:Histidine protein methyltransferase 1 [Grifola frondosa]